MARYKIADEDLIYAQEFLQHPVGYQSPGLQRVLNVMRNLGPAGKYVLLIKERYSRWGLGRLPKGRGEPIEVIRGVEYTSLLEAERDVFRRRWRDLTGKDLNSQLKLAGSVNADKKGA